jgi:hypothetical protein
MRASPRALVLLVASLVSGCPKRETDEDRLRKRIDVLPVHLYVGAKATLAEAGDEVTARATRQLLRDLVVPRQAPQSRPAEATGDELSATDVARLAGSVVHLRSRGAALVREGKEHPPVLPALLGRERVPKLSASAEHGLIMLAFVLARFHPKAGLPIPEELILYEASRTEPSTIDPRQLGLPVRVFKTYVLARNQLCDLALREAEALEKAPTREDVVALLGLARSGQPEPRAVDGVSAGLEALTQGAVSLCYFQRDEEKKARKALKAMLDAARRGGLAVPPELERLESADKAALARLLIELTVTEADKLGVTRELEGSTAFRAVRRLGLLTGKLGPQPAAGAARAVWKRLRGQSGKKD